MKSMLITNYAGFIEALLEAGFALGSGCKDGIFSLIPWSWDEAPPNDMPIRWHTGDLETDPWEWRMRVLNERSDIAYGKVFFRKSGYITREWAPYFIAARRGDQSLEDAYQDGGISHSARRIYHAVHEHNGLSLHDIKRVAGFGQADKSRFDYALVELQMKMYLTMCGMQQKLSHKGVAYGWSSTVFCTTERFWGEGVFEKARALGAMEAAAAIQARVLMLYPEAKAKSVRRFIAG